MSWIIIGFGRQSRKDLGETGVEQQCAWCSRKIYYHLILLRTWFSYFFIPVFPYRSEYFIECPLCSQSIGIRGEEVEAAKRGELSVSRTSYIPSDGQQP